MIVPNVAVSVLVVLDVEPGAAAEVQFAPVTQLPAALTFQVASAAWAVCAAKNVAVGMATKRRNFFGFMCLLSLGLGDDAEDDTRRWIGRFQKPRGGTR